MEPRDDDRRTRVARVPVLRRASGCPIDVAHALLSGRWRLPIIIALLDGPARFSDLRRALPEISANILTQKLRQLQTDGLLHRDSEGSAPATYALSSFGSGLKPAVEALKRWACRNETV